MTSLNELRLAALIRLQMLCETLVLLLTPIDGYTDLKISLEKAIKKIKDARAINEASIKDKAQLKKESRLAMVALITHYLQIAQVKALTAGATDLIAALNFTKTYLTRADTSVVGVRAEEIKNIIKANLTILTNILAADITLMEEAIAVYNLLEKAPKDAIDYRKTKGTDPIPELLNQAEIPRDYIGKIFHASLPEQADLYDKAIMIGQPVSQRHISAIINYLDAETSVAMPKVKATFTHGDAVHIKLSTIKGNARFTSLLPGNYSLASEIKGYFPVLKNNIPIDDKHILKLTIKLQKLVLSATLQVQVNELGTSLPLKDVKLLLPEIGAIILTNENGIALKTNLPPATYQGMLTLPGYKNIDFTFTLDPKQTLKLEFMMEKLT